MNRPTLIRATAAAFAAFATSSVFDAVISLSEPQRTAGFAAAQARQWQAPRPVVVAGKAE